MSIKQRIPDVETLRTRLDMAFDRGIADFIARTDQRRIIVLRNRRLTLLVGVVFIVSVVLLAIVSQPPTEPWIYQFFAMVLLGLCVATIIFAHRWYQTTKVLAQEVNLALVPTLTTCLDQLVIYTHHSEHREETRAQLAKSELLTERVDTLAADDRFSFTEPYPTTITELSASKTVTRGTRSREEQVFSGTFAVVTLPVTLEGTTFISTEGDQHGFGHRTFWNTLLGNTSYTETELEWNDFERDLHVATDHPVEARTILTPDFMQDLHAWWHEHGQNIRISVRGSSFFLLLPDANIRIGTSTTSVRPRELKAYSMTVLTPIWRTLTLVEDLQFSNEQVR